MPNYKKTKLACYLGFITQAIVANFTPLLFLTFHNDYHISLGKISLIPVCFYFMQLRQVSSYQQIDLDKSRKHALQLLAYDNDNEKDQYDRKASQREGKDTVTCGWEPLMTEDRKPTLESCARRNVHGSGEAQRRTGVNGDRAGYIFVSIRVVPPSDRSLFRER